MLARWYDFRDLGNGIARMVQALRDAGAPEGVVYALTALAGCLGILLFVGLTSIANIWVERRLVGRIQVRRGPNRAGPFGLLQPGADAIKLIPKEALTARVALGSTTTIVVFMAGYASNNKYALLGSMRVIAMLISYELPGVLALLGVVVFAGTMSLRGIVAVQG